MAHIDLSIIDRGTSGSSWVPENVIITPDHLDDVMEQKNRQQRCAQFPADTLCPILRGQGSFPSCNGRTC